MPTYPAHIPCPRPGCGQIAANLTVPYPVVVARFKDGTSLSRFFLRTDSHKPGPSHRLVVCQHCHHAFKASESLIVDQPRTLA